MHLIYSRLWLVKPFTQNGLEVSQNHYGRHHPRPLLLSAWP